MSRGTWNISYEASGGSWIPDGTIAPPNENLEIGLTSTKQRIELSNGDIAYVTPEVKYNKDEMTWRWLMDDGTIKTKLETYLQNDTHLKIEDSNGDYYYGYFTKIKRVWIVGTADDEYDIDATFSIKA